jgi:hypothetical protein
MTSHPAALSMILSIRGSAKLSLGQALLRLVKSIYIHHLPLFFCTMTTLASHVWVGDWFDEIGLKQALYLGFGGFCFLIIHFA